MKKNLILTVILTATLFTACGKNEASVDTAAETSSTESSVTQEVTLNSVTEMTLPAVEPEVQTSLAQEPETPAQPPAQTAETATITTTAPIETTPIKVETTAETSAGDENKEYEIYEAVVLSNSGTYIAVELRSDSFFGSVGDEAHIYGEFDAEKGELVHISFLVDEVEVNESYPPEVHCSKTQVTVFEYAADYDLPYDSGEEIIKHEYSAKVTVAGENFITVQLLEDTFFGKSGDEVIFKGVYDVAAEELITFIISEEAPVSEGNPKQIAEEHITVKGTADGTSEQTYDAEVVSVNDSSVHVKMKSGAFFASAGDEVVLGGSYDVAVGDSIEFTLSGNVEVLDSYPVQINEEYILGLVEQSYVLEITAIVKEVYESKLGGYSLVVDAYALPGYTSPTPLSLYSEVKYEKGDELIVEFAEGTVFMETSPLQVNNEDVLRISKS